GGDARAELAVRRDRPMPARRLGRAEDLLDRRAERPGDADRDVDGGRGAAGLDRAERLPRDRGAPGELELREPRFEPDLAGAIAASRHVSHSFHVERSHVMRNRPTSIAIRSGAARLHAGSGTRGRWGAAPTAATASSPTWRTPTSAPVRPSTP